MSTNVKGSGASLSNGSINYANARQITQKDFEETDKRTNLQPNDIVVTNSGTIGRMALVKDVPVTRRTTFQKSVAIIKPNSQKVLPIYLYYILQHNVNYLVNNSVGSAQKNLLLSTMRDFMLEVHSSLPTQRRIASILSAYDNLIENNTRRIRLLEQMAENLYKEWFVRFRFPGHEKVEFENGLPKGWKVERYYNVAKITAGGDRPSIFSRHPTEKCTIPIYSNGLEDDGLYGFTNKAKIRKPCITISARGTVGFVCLRRNSFVPIVRLLTVVPNEFLNVYYLYHSSKYNDLEGNGTSQQQLTVPMLNKRKLLIPSIDLLLLFEKMVKPIYDQIDTLKYQSANLSRQRDLLLPRLMSGKLEVKE